MDKDAPRVFYEDLAELLDGGVFALVASERRLPWVGFLGIYVLLDGFLDPGAVTSLTRLFDGSLERVFERSLLGFGDGGRCPV